MITPDRIKALSREARVDMVMALVNGWPAIRDAGINTPLRLAHFMAQIATETGGFTIYTENMNYSAQRMTEVWPSHFRTIEAAAPYAHNPEKLANFIYDDAHRSDSFKLGNTHPGDGWRYRGRGFIQTTGREGYRKVGHEDDPDLLTDPKEGLKAAIAEFVRAGCLALSDRDNLNAVRQAINGGLTGIVDARLYLARAKVIFQPLASAPAPAAPIPAPTAPAPRDPAPGQAVKPVVPPVASKKVAVGIAAIFIAAIAGAFGWLSAAVSHGFHAVLSIFGG